MVGINNMLFGQRTSDWANLNRYRQANVDLPYPAEGENRVVFMGNSITDFWIDDFPEFFAENNYIDRGISGQTTPQMLVRFRADVIHLKPAVVHILAGTNDLAGNTGPSTPEMILDNIASMAELAKAHDIKVIIASVLPATSYFWKPESPKPAHEINELNELLKTYAAANDCFYLDYYSRMVNENEGLKEEYSEDGVHPNKAGYQVMMQVFDESITEVLKR